jgi:hypothetical protein
MKKEYLYHYTSISSAIKILETNQFHVTKNEYMNDPSETQYALKLYLEEMEKYSESEQKYFEPLRNWITVANRARDYFILSLSKNNDSLSLWNRYGSVNGCCIYLDIEELNKRFRKLSNSDILFQGFKEVTYSEIIQKKFITMILKKYLDIEKNNIHFPAGTTESTDIEFDIYDSLYEFKHEAYKDEEEIRGIFSIPNTNSYIVEDIWRKNVKFKTGTYITPYLIIDCLFDGVFGGINLSPLIYDKRIENGLKEYLLYKHFPVNIYKSSIPYRQ